MLEITREQIAVLRFDPTLAPAVVSRLSDPIVATKNTSLISDNEWDDLHDACLEALINNSPDVESFDCEQSKGVYTVTIRGVPGGYFVFAVEFDNTGIFSTLEEARAEADDTHGEFRVRDGADPEEDLDEDNEQSLPESADSTSGTFVPENPEAVEFVRAFEKTLPPPQGAISGMARFYKKLPRMIRKVEQFMEKNGRLPDHDEAAVLYESD